MNRRCAALWAAAVFGSTALGHGCAVSFKDYPVGDLGSGGVATQSGGSTGLGAAGTGTDASVGGRDGSAGGPGGSSAGAGAGGAGTGGAGTGGAGTGGAGTGGGTGGSLPDGSTAGCGPAAPSCQGGLLCGSGDDCCATVRIPGGSFNRGGNATYPATVGDFCLDTYEVTVGRFRAFVQAYDAWYAGGQRPAVNDGEVRSGDGTGWKQPFESNLPSTAAGFLTASRLLCDSVFQTWPASDAGTKNDTLPINCVSWFEAYAFCIWDGGRLPTDAEFEYAAGHGSENRKYPWGSAPYDSTRATYDCTHGGVGSCTFSDIVPVGSKPAGNGFWGQADLAGSMAEWVRDNYVSPYSITNCDNCVCDVNPANSRSVRGGSFYLGTDSIQVAYRNEFTPWGNDNDTGFRCARRAP
jgi:formylglycine-generating enzyme